MIRVLHQWLVELEESLQRMIGGVFLFFSDWLPRWIYEFIIDGILPLMVRMARVSLWFCLWLVILFFPWTPGLVFHLAWWWKCGSLIWLAMAGIGSYWGLKRLIKKRKASAVGAGMADTTGSSGEIVLAVSVKEGHSRSGIQKR
ncbi:MAG: hypothetical protein WCB27_25455 [Thermoguttaceae bacterium]|jgi:hypothetical protein